MDIVKVGWGISYIDPTMGARVSICAEHGCPVSLGGTLLEVAALQDRVSELRDWALSIGVTHVEVSNGLRALPESRKHALVKELAAYIEGSHQARHLETPAIRRLFVQIRAAAPWSSSRR